MSSYVLSFETSCDDTSVALMDRQRKVLWCQAANQDTRHKIFGGVVPEIASRAHTETILPLVDLLFQEMQITWDDIFGIAVTTRPGLIGSLMVGLMTAKTLAMAKKKPFVSVNHIEAHLLAPWLWDDKHVVNPQFQFPYLALAVSGGHSHYFHVKSWGDYELLGHTLDDAAGEAFDKFAKMVGLGFPGGVQVDSAAQKGNPKAYNFPRSMIHEDNAMLSFSGLKSSALRLLSTMTKDDIEKNLNDLCASFQEAIVDTLISKLDWLHKKFPTKSVVITGGVSANSRLRSRAQDWADKRKLILQIPPLRYCTDNAAMVAAAGLWRLEQGINDNFSVAASASSLDVDFSLRVQR